MDYKLIPDTVLVERYQIKKVLSDTSDHMVYLAKDVKITEKSWVLKEYAPPKDDKFNEEELKEREAQFHETLETIANFEHPGLPKILDFFPYARRHYVVMEHVEGITLQHILEMSVEPLKEAQILEWAIQIADVLSYLHTRPKPFVHTHLDQSHIMVDSSNRIRLLNLGLNRFFDPSQVPKAFSSSPYDVVDDFFELGKTMFYLFVKKEYNPGEIFVTIPGASEKVSKIIMRLLSDDPQRNYRDAQELSRDLNKILHPEPAAEQAAEAKAAAPGRVPFYVYLLPTREKIDRIIYAILSQKLIYFALEILAIIAALFIVWLVRHPGWNYTKKIPVIICACKDELWTIDGKDKKLLDRSKIEGELRCIVEDQGNPRVFMSNVTHSSILVMNTLHNEIVRTIQVDTAPSKMIVSGQNIFCINEPTNNISLVDTKECAMTSIIPTGDRPVDMAFSTTGGMLYISDSGSKTLHVVNPITNLTKKMLTYESGTGPIALSADEKILYLSNTRPAGLTLVNPESLETIEEIVIPELTSPSYMRLSAEGDCLYILDRDAYTLFVYSLEDKKIVASMQVGKNPVDMTFDRDGKIWVANYGSHNISIVNAKLRYVEDTLDVGRNPWAIKFLP